MDRVAATGAVGPWRSLGLRQGNGQWCGNKPHRDVRAALGAVGAGGVGRRGGRVGVGSTTGHDEWDDRKRHPAFVRCVARFRAACGWPCKTNKSVLMPDPKHTDPFVFPC